MQYTINELKQKVFGKVFDVYGIFKDFFGERFTDLQEIPDDLEFKEALGNYVDVTQESFEVSNSNLRLIKESYSTLKPYILVWWPTVTVTNENDRSVDIQDLYAKITITMEGTLPWEYSGFKLTRTTFSEIQYASGYCHSHVPHFSGVPNFQDPCLGTGPIRHTIMDLHGQYEEALWMLFCQELSLYVTVESLRGGPYFRMESIGFRRTLSNYVDYIRYSGSFEGLANFWRHSSSKRQLFKDLLKHFTSYYLEKGHLVLNYKEGIFVSGMPFFDFIIDISNSFIDFYNQYGQAENVQDLYDRYILEKALAANNKFYLSDSVQNADTSLEGSEMFVFKGEMKHLHIFSEENTYTETTTLLNWKIAGYLLGNILKIINYRYRNEHTKQLNSSSPTTAAPTYQTVIYI